jgi:hypothetical protein
MALDLMLEQQGCNLLFQLSAQVTTLLEVSAPPPSNFFQKIRHAPAAIRPSPFASIPLHSRARQFSRRAASSRVAEAETAFDGCPRMKRIPANKNPG